MTDIALEHDRDQTLHPLYTEEGVAAKPLLIFITLIYSQKRPPDSSIWHPCGSTPACTMRATNPLRSSSPGSRCRFNAIALPTCCELVDTAGACTYAWLVRHVYTIHCMKHARYPRVMHGIRGTASSSRYVSGCAALSRYSSAPGRTAGASSSWASGHTLLLWCDTSKTEKVRCVQAHTSAPSLSAARTVTYRYAFVGVCGCVSVTLWCVDTYIQCAYAMHETYVNITCPSAVRPVHALNRC